MSADEFKAQRCDKPYKLRRAEVNKLFDQNDYKYFELLPLLYVGEDTSMISRFLMEQILLNEEGIMINDWNAPYEFKRSNALLKCKQFNTCDLRVIDFEPGEGKYTGMLGAFICEYKGGEVKIGSGLTDELRKKVWDRRSEYVNTIIEVSYFEETVDSTGKKSLRFPTFKDFRFDKTEPSYY
jgi:DNA ligase-1